MIRDFVIGFRFVTTVQLVALRKMLGRSPELHEVVIGDDEFLPHDKFVITLFSGVLMRQMRHMRTALKRAREEASA
jgi:hypothetical protein